MRHALKLTALVLLLGAIATTVLVSMRHPSLSRVWDADVRVLAGVEFPGNGSVYLTNIRDWSYT